MKHVVAFVALLMACSREVETLGPPRPSVTPTLAVSVHSGLRAPDPACTCASPESFPAPSKYEAECAGSAVCVDVHYAEWVARTRQSDALGALLATHYVESKLYEATISFPARGGDSTYRVSIGDVVPTPRGRARVVQVHRSFVDDWDDGYVTLHLLEPERDVRGKVFVSSGAPSHVRGVAMTMVRAEAGIATLVVADGSVRKVDVKKGDAITTSAGVAKVDDVVNGIVGSTIGWVEISAPE